MQGQLSSETYSNSTGFETWYGSLLSQTKYYWQHEDESDIKWRSYEVRNGYDDDNIRKDESLQGKQTIKPVHLLKTKKCREGPNKVKQRQLDGY